MGLAIFAAHYGFSSLSVCVKHLVIEELHMFNYQLYDCVCVCM